MFSQELVYWEPSINNVGNCEVRRVKNWSKLVTDSTKKMPTWGRGCQKSGKIADVVYGWSLSIYLATLVFNSVYISTMNGEYDLLVEFNYFPGVHSAGEQRRCSFLAFSARPRA